MLEHPVGELMSPATRFGLASAYLLDQRVRIDPERDKMVVVARRPDLSRGDRHLGMELHTERAPNGEGLGGTRGPSERCRTWRHTHSVQVPNQPRSRINQIRASGLHGQPTDFRAVGQRHNRAAQNPAE